MDIETPAETLKDHQDPRGERTVAPLVSPALDALFWRPSRLGVESAWYGHVPFAQWVMTATRPGCFVELGSHAGVSYAAFCDAVLRARTATRCFAVDTWRGDEHAGFYGDEVFNDLAAFHERHYAGFSKLLRCTFDEALDYIPDGSVDLLHIDGRHHYEDVSHDYNAWLPKLSARAVVLFHDTNVRERDFGVWRLWEELRRQHPSFEFLHAHGLGVLAQGKDAPEAILALCATGEVERVRERFSLLGERWEQDFLRVRIAQHAESIRQDLESLKQEAQAAHETALGQIAHERGRVEKQEALFEEEKAMLFRQTAGLQYDVENLRNDLAHAQAELSHAAAKQAHDEASIAHLSAEAAHLSAELAHNSAELSFTMAKLSWTENALSMLQVERDILMHSTIWRVMQILKRIALMVPAPVRHGLIRLRRRGAPAPQPFISGEVPPKTLEQSETRQNGEAPAAMTAPSTAAPTLPAQNDTPAKKALPKPVGIPRPVAPPRAAQSQRIVFISGEPETPGNDYRVLRAVHAAGLLGWQAQALTVETATNDRLEGADIVVIWRATWSAEIDRIYAHCRKTGAVTIFDVDDLMFRPELARTKLIDGIRSQRLQELDVQRFYVRINQSVRAADLCSCTTSELASHLRLFKKPAFVVPNCWDQDTWRRSRMAVRRRRASEKQGEGDGLLRIGYASGTRTHQKDFAVVASAVARVLRENADCRLVLFRDAASKEGIVVADEFDVLNGLEEQIEWRDKVALQDLAGEVARFDINLAPLEVGNPFCEAKSELKHWEAALVNVPTVASPTGPFKRAIEHGRTGFLASNEDDWYNSLSKLVHDAGLRARLSHAAQLDVLWRFGPLHHTAAVGSLLDQARGGRPAARAMLLDLLSSRTMRPEPVLPEREIVFEQDKLGQAEVTVIVPVYNYAHYVTDALDSVAAQTTQMLDLIIIEDCSKDGSLAVVTEWAQANAAASTGCSSFATMPMQASALAGTPASTWLRRRSCCHSMRTTPFALNAVRGCSQPCAIPVPRSPIRPSAVSGRTTCSSATSRSSPHA